MIGKVEWKQCPYAAGMVGISKNKSLTGPSLPDVSERRSRQHTGTEMERCHGCQKTNQK